MRDDERQEVLIEKGRIIALIGSEDKKRPAVLLVEEETGGKRILKTEAVPAGYKRPDVVKSQLLPTPDGMELEVNIVDPGGIKVGRTDIAGGENAPAAYLTTQSEAEPQHAFSYSELASGFGGRNPDAVFMTLNPAAKRPLVALAWPTDEKHLAVMIFYDSQVESDNVAAGCLNTMTEGFLVGAPEFYKTEDLYNKTYGSGKPTESKLGSLQSAYVHLRMMMLTQEARYGGTQAIRESAAERLRALASTDVLGRGKVVQKVLEEELGRAGLSLGIESRDIKFRPTAVQTETIKPLTEDERCQLVWGRWQEEVQRGGVFNLTRPKGNSVLEVRTGYDREIYTPDYVRMNPQWLVDPEVAGKYVQGGVVKYRQSDGEINTGEVIWTNGINTGINIGPMTEYNQNYIQVIALSEPFPESLMAGERITVPGGDSPERDLIPRGSYLKPKEEKTRILSTDPVKRLVQVTGDESGRTEWVPLEALVYANPDKFDWLNPKPKKDDRSVKSVVRGAIKFTTGF